MTEDEIRKQINELVSKKIKLTKDHEKTIDSISATIAELQNDLQNLKQEESDNLVCHIAEHRDIILPLFKHTGKDCSDDNVDSKCNYHKNYCECSKCKLLEVLEEYDKYGYVSDDCTFSFSIDVEF
jgi:hypothetical protein